MDHVKRNTASAGKGQLSTANVWAIAFGCIIGWGSFINPGTKFLPNSGTAGTFIAMLLGAAVMIILSFSYAYMTPRFPQSGGEFNFAKQCFGPFPAFICGWFLIAAYITIIPMNSTAIGLIVDGLDGPLDLLKFGYHYQVAGFDVWMGETILASCILILFGILNIIGVKKAGAVQTCLTSMLLLSAAVLCIAGIVSGKADLVNLEPVWGFDKAAAAAAGAGMDLIPAYAHTGKDIVSAILATFAITPWAYVGFATIPQVADEYEFSFNKVIGIMVFAILFGCFVYVSNNTIAAAAMKDWPERVLAGEWVLLSAADEMLGTFGRILVGTGVSCAVLGGMMGFYLTTSRLIYSMSRDGFLPGWFGKLDKRYKTPKNAIIFCIVIALSGPVLGREALGWFVDMSSIGASIGYFFTCASALSTMKKQGDGTPGIRICALAGAAFSVLFIILQLVPIPGLNGVHFGKQSYILFLIWTLMGLFFSFRQRNTKQNNND